jgi:hypothetical protein
VFLAFRIQREADFYRTPGHGWGEQHFTSSFFLIILGTLTITLFGVVFPLVYLSGVKPNWLTSKLVVAGMLAAIVLLVGYFADELVHYRILRPDLRGWRREWPLVAVTVLLAVLTAASWLALTT